MAFSAVQSVEQWVVVRWRWHTTVFGVCGRATEFAYQIGCCSRMALVYREMSVCQCQIYHFRRSTLSKWQHQTINIIHTRDVRWCFPRSECGKSFLLRLLPNCHHIHNEMKFTFGPIWRPLRLSLRTLSMFYVHLYEMNAMIIIHLHHHLIEKNMIPFNVPTRVFLSIYCVYLCSTLTTLCSPAHNMTRSCKYISTH